MGLFPKELSPYWSLAKTLTNNKRALKGIERLEKLYTILEEYGYSNYISFDLGMIGQYDYYTGIIFKGYTYGTGDAIVTGGRYDNLLKQFGKNAPAIGFAIDVDRLMSALSRQKIDVAVNYDKTMVLYMPSMQKNAIDLAGMLRKSGVNTELIRKRSVKNIDDYIAYATHFDINTIYYLEGKGSILQIDVKEQIHKNVKLEQIKEELA